MKTSLEKALEDIINSQTRLSKRIRILETIEYASIGGSSGSSSTDKQIILFKAFPNTLAYYEYSYYGLTLAVGAADSGDTIFIPSGTISWGGTFTIPDNIELIGFDNTVLSGDIANNGILRDITVTGDMTIGATGRTDYAEIVTVAPEGADFSSIQDAIDSISDASVTKPYLVRIYPGTYYEQVTCKEWVDLKGDRKSTIIRYNDSNGAIILASHIMISELRIRVSDDSANDWAIVGDNTDGVHIRSVDILSPLFDYSYVGHCIKITGNTWLTLFIEDCILNSYHTTGASIRLDGNSHDIDATINNCFIDAYSATSGNGGCITINTASDIQIRNSLLRTDNGHCVKLNGNEVQIVNTFCETDNGVDGLVVNSGTMTLAGVAGMGIDDSGGNVYGEFLKVNNNDTAIKILRGDGAGVQLRGNGGTEGILYQDSGGTTRYGVLFPGSDVVQLCNRAADGVVKIAANTAVAGAGGEITVAEFRDTAVVINEDGGDVNFRAEGDSEINMLYLDADVDILYFGGTTNGVKIEKGGELTLIGTATVWDDIRVPLSSIKRLGFTDPDWVKFQDDGGAPASTGVYALAFDDTTEEEIFFALQIPHGWKLGSDIEPHVHWSTLTGNAGNVVWALEYTISDIGGTFGATDTESAACIGNATAYYHEYGDIGSIDMSSYTDPGDISIMLICRLYRDVASGSDTLTGDAILLEIDFHYEIDTMGSRTESSKT